MHITIIYLPFLGEIIICIEFKEVETYLKRKGINVSLWYFQPIIYVIVHKVYKKKSSNIEYFV